MSNPQKYTIGWICAITTESVAAQAFFDEKHDNLETTADNDNNTYSLGRIGKHNVVMAVLPKSIYGMTSATIVARDMLRSFPNIRFGLMVGIGGGVPNSRHNICLGDIVVSTCSNGRGSVFQYDYGKAIQGHTFITTGFLNQPPQLLLTALSGIEARHELEGHQLSAYIDRVFEQRPHLRKKYSRPPPDSDRLYRPDVIHSDKCGDMCSSDPAFLVDRTKWNGRENDPAIHYGLIASANQLMKDALARDKLAASMDVLCFEMEAAGLMNHFPCLVIRGICDYSDSHKNKEWQGFAAMMAAAYAKDLLSEIPPNKVEAEKPISEILQSIKSTENVIKQEVISMKSDNHAAKIKRWLSPPDYSTNASLARKRHHPGTGTWLLDNSVFQEWELGSRQHLWLYGLAGCGKTILSTTILDHLLSSGAHTTLAFFFDFNDPSKQKLENLLSSLAVQLYHTGKEAARKLDNLFASCDEQRQPDTTALATCVNEMIQATGKVVVVLDALDECTTRRELLDWIKGLASSNAQLVVTGRPEADFQSELPRLFDKRNCILLDKKAVNADICSYVTATLKEKPEFVNKKLPQDLLDNIRDKIGNGADGMFRWAACQLESLTQCLSPKDIETALKSLPRDLNETYHRMIQNIPTEYKCGAIRLLQFLVYTKRPLKVSETIEVIAMQVDQESYSFDVGGRLFQERDVLRYCPSLTIIAEVKTYDGVVVEELHLAHFSVKEYLLKQTQFNLESASIVITRTCLTYLGDIKSDHSSLRDDFPMAQYAAKYWMDYAVSAETSKDIVRTAVNFLQDETTFKRWCHLYQADIPWEDDPGPPRASRLYYACLGGLTETARNLTANSADVNTQGGEYGNALQAASYKGYREIVKLLVDKGADVNAQGGNLGNALQAASIKDYQEIVKLLVDKGADVNAQGGFYGNALQASSYEGYREIVKLLVDKGADVNAQGGYFGNALQAASSGGHQEIVKLLMDKGADVNAQGGNLGNALQAASYKGHQEIVKLLVDKGADVNAQGGYFGNALQAASSKGHREIVKLLMDKGADVNAQGGNLGNALQAASFGGDQDKI